jgi:hypothetical protein
MWPRPSGVRLPPAVHIVYPDSTAAAVPTLPPGVVQTAMPDLPYGLVLPPKSQAVQILGSASGKYPLPEGAILATGVTVLDSDELIPEQVAVLNADADGHLYTQVLDLRRSRDGRRKENKEIANTVAVPI